MDNLETKILGSIALAPYIQVSTALIGKARRIGGNQFRHNWATVGILIDHKILEPIILKAGVIHDLKEDAIYDYHPEQIRLIDEDGNRVVELVEELSIGYEEKKIDYLKRVMQTGSKEAKIIKLADRISNLIDIQLGIFDIAKIKQTLNETREYILPFARDINENMYLEMVDLVNSRNKYMQQTIKTIANGLLTKIKEIALDNEIIEEQNTTNPPKSNEEYNAAFKRIELELTSDFFIHSVYKDI